MPIPLVHFLRHKPFEIQIGVSAGKLKVTVILVSVTVVKVNFFQEVTKMLFNK